MRIEAAKRFASISTTSIPSGDMPDRKFDPEILVVVNLLALMEKGVG